MYVKQTDFGWGVFIRGWLVREFATEEDAEQFLAERTELYKGAWNY